MTKILSSIVTFAGIFATDAYSKFLPDNDLHLRPRGDLVSNINRRSFDKIIKKVTDIYKPIAEGHGHELVVNKNWGDDEVNAFADEIDGAWHVNMYGGLARRPEVTKDGLALIFCHEIGHHLAGFPLSTKKLANEGSADYFATHVCAPNVWRDDFEANAKVREKADAVAKGHCDGIYHTEDEQNLCYRVNMAGRSIAELFRAVYESEPISFDTPDAYVTDETDDYHPEAQCRLDTFLAGSLCTVEFDDLIIPGNGFTDPVAAESDSYRYSCSRSAGDKIGLRPLCWYKPQVL